ncbi:hypothetical protein HNR42_001216 [Deinobacterium chartae]|uniref:Uncharacterized protein n=1 Tax=Deinobacterium chartae TaxID=521158 RepID=A0A841HY36_9DEIO|nr:hypothetical protein [Deinobacterium chartae]MBB6097793.1 hypothetical protein [Deinobacterium chartae]
MPSFLEARCYLTLEDPETVIAYYRRRGAHTLLQTMQRPVAALSLHLNVRTDVRGYEVPDRRFGLHDRPRNALAAQRPEFMGDLQREVQQVLAYALLHDLTLIVYQGEDALILHDPASVTSG